MQAYPTGTTFRLSNHEKTIANHEAAAADAARRANEHAGRAARSALEGDELAAWLARSQSRAMRSVSRYHADRAAHARQARTTAWLCGEWNA